MRGYGQISTGWWQSKTIAALPNDSARYLFVYLVAGPHTNSLGCFRLPKAYVAEDLGYDIDTVSKLFQALEKAGLIRYCDASKWLLIPNFLKYQPPANPKVGIAVEKLFVDVPQNAVFYRDLCESLLRNNKHLSDDFLSRIDTVSKQYRNIEIELELELEHEHEQVKTGNPIGVARLPPKCPHQEIIALYHETLPELQAVNVALWNGERAKHLQARWREHEAHRDIDFWREFFETVRTNPHWMGENERGWRADLGWLVKPANFAKVVERGMSEVRRHG